MMIKQHNISSTSSWDKKIILMSFDHAQERLIVSDQTIPQKSTWLYHVTNVVERNNIVYVIPLKLAVPIPNTCPTKILVRHFLDIYSTS